MVEVLHDGDLVSLRTSKRRPTFIVNSPEFVQEILAGKDEFFRKGRSSDVLRRTIGDGLLTTERAQHHRQKKYMTPAFYKERIQMYARIVEEETARIADEWTDGLPVAMHDAMMRLTLGIIARSMFATELEERKAELAEAVDVTIRRTAQTLFSPFSLPFAVPTPRHQSHKRAIQKLESMVYEAIEDAKANPGRYKDCLLGLLLDTKDEEGTPLPDKEIRDQMMTMLLAGHETTANALVWAWHLLARNPQAAELFYRELDAVYAEEELPGATVPPFELFRKLAYTQRVVQETLRLYPPAWIILREAVAEVDLLGETFPAGSSFLISPYAMHRNDRVFGDAGAFRPDRFAEESGGWPRFAYFPFGWGSRGCIGSQFAMMEATLILAGLGRRFRFVSEPGVTTEPEPLVSLRVRGGLRMIPQERGAGG
nr:cytochrome P450 [Paenibacillus hamazuiensis]